MQKRLIGALLDRTSWRLAWRDTRNQRGRLALFMAAIVLGVAALVAIESFGTNVLGAIDEQAQSLLGADLQVRSRMAFTDEAQAVFAEADAEQSRQWSTSTMLYVPATEQSRFVQLRALDGGFPWYGTLEAQPAEAAQLFREGDNRALVHESVLIQLGLKSGDTVRLGNASFTVVGALLKVPGEMGNFSALAPPVYVSFDGLAATGLIQPGSRVFYQQNFRFRDPAAMAATQAALEPLADDDRLRVQTIEDRKENIGDNMRNMYRYLGLVGFVALLLGGIGVGSSVHVYMRDKISTVAVLRCLGATPQQTMAIYLIQATLMGLGGSAIGVILGVVVQYGLPSLFGAMLPVQMTVSPAWGAILLGLVIGTAVTVAFSLLPLLSVRRISPLLALRADVEPPTISWRDPARLGVYGLMAALIIGFALRQADEWYRGLGAAAGVFVAMALLVGVAKLLMWAVRRWFPSSWPYVWRQGLNNLYRPNNQTVTLMLCLGLGACLIMTLYLAQTSLMQQLARSDEDGRVNMVLFDVQTDQVEGVQETVRDQDMPVIATVPMVTMRLTELKGRPVHELRREWKDDPDHDRGTWSLDREYRSTYRDHTTASETVTAGEFVDRVEDVDFDTVIPVSAEEDIAEELGLAIGDILVFDVQGIPVTCRLASLRKVDWMRMETNFFFVFPAGVLEDAPQTIAVLTRAADAQQSADLQRAAVKRFANVSVVDLALLLNTVDEIVDRIAFAIRFMALFSIGTGLVVLIGSVTTSRYHLIKESTLLRTLGASRRQIQSILLVEYLLLGSFAAFAGIILAHAAAWGIVTFAFESTFIPTPLPIFIAWAVVASLTMATGVLNNLDILRKPPLAVIRAEG